MLQPYPYSSLMGAFLVFWLTGIVYFVFDSDSELNQKRLKTLEYVRLNKRAQELEVENHKLRRDLLNFDARVEAKKPQVEDSSAPSREYEESRRTVKRDVDEMWWYVQGDT